MVVLAVAMQLAVVQLQAIVPPRIFDVDLVIVRGTTDTMAMPLLRLADGLEGRVMLSQTTGPSLILRTTVRQDKATGCNALTLGIGQLVSEQSEIIFVPKKTSHLCGVETIEIASEGGPTVMAKVRLLPMKATPDRP